MTLVSILEPMLAASTNEREDEAAGARLASDLERLELGDDQETEVEAGEWLF
jgi:hypothetical protein